MSWLWFCEERKLNNIFRNWTDVRWIHICSRTSKRKTATFWRRNSVHSNFRTQLSCNSVALWTFAWTNAKAFNAAMAKSVMDDENVKSHHRPMVIKYSKFPCQRSSGSTVIPHMSTKVSSQRNCKIMPKILIYCWKWIICSDHWRTGAKTDAIEVGQSETGTQ